MTTLSIRIDEQVKAKAGKTLSAMGIDMSTAVKIFLNQVIAEDGLPFIPTKNPAQIRAKWDKEVAQALKTGKSYKNARELFIDLDK